MEMARKRENSPGFYPGKSGKGFKKSEHRQKLQHNLKKKNLTY